MQKKIRRENFGKSIVTFPDTYVVVDIETTGLNSRYDSIIEISALRYSYGEFIDKYVTLINPGVPIGSFITKLTGITDEMVKDRDDISICIKEFKEFVKDDLIVGYNVNFDMGFLYDNLKVIHNEYLSNDYVDVLRLTRRLLPQLQHHRQTDIAEYYGIDVQGAHRAEKDCMICEAIFEKMKEEVLKQNISLEEFANSFKVR